jgi:nitrate reductase NapE component
MVGVVSGVALVGVFGAVTWLCTILAARLYRAGSHGQPRQPGDS